MVLAGDFNAANINWVNNEINGNVATSEKLLDILDEHELSHVVQEPTRRQGNSQSLLDLVLANNTESIRKVKVVPGISDHDIVSFNLKVYCQRKRPVKRKIYIRKKADHDKIKQEFKKFSEYYVQRSHN